MLTFSHRLLLLDEPEAFLHPAQARALGRWLANRAKTTPTQIILATHNADFLWGIVSENPDAAVIRLNRSGNVTRYHAVPSETTKNLVQSPLLSSQPVMDALFQKGVAVCEGDPDRAIYQTVAHGEQLRRNGGEDVLFIHANGKDAAKTPVELLRQAGTPVCAIVDIDVLNSGQVLGELLESLTGRMRPAEAMQLRDRIAEVVEKTTEEQLLANLRLAVQEWEGRQHSDLRQARRALRNIAQLASKWDEVKTRGLDYFGEETRPDVERLIKLCRELGLFIVQKGELEGWIPLGVAKGKKWNRRALEELHAGRLPVDLQDFVAGVVAFLRSPADAIEETKQVEHA